MRAPVFRELRALLRLAAPLAAAQAGTQLMGLVDIAVLGRLGAREIGGSVMGMGLLMGVDPLMSQASGAGDRVRARRVLWQGLWLSLCVSAALTLVLVGATVALPYIGSDAELIEPATTYLLVRLTGIL